MHSTPPNLSGIQAVGSINAVSVTLVALGACGFYAVGSTWLPAFSLPMIGSSVSFGLYGLMQIPQVWQSIAFNRRLTNLGIDWCTIDDLAEKINLSSGPAADRWLGYGFHWEPSHRQAMSTFMSEDWHAAFTDRMKQVVARKYFREHPLNCFSHPLRTYGAVKAQQQRIAQAIMRGETVIVFDPKNDISIEQVCEACSRKNKFIRIHLSLPEESAPRI